MIVTDNYAVSVYTAGYLVNCHLSFPILIEFSKFYCNHMKQKFCHLLFTLGNVNWVTYTNYLRNMHYCINESIIYRLYHWIVENVLKVMSEVYNSIPILCTVNDIQLVPHCSVWHSISTQKHFVLWENIRLSRRYHKFSFEHIDPSI
jgi:hypothetical protein